MQEFSSKGIKSYHIERSSWKNSCDEFQASVVYLGIKVRQIFKSGNTKII